MERIFAVMTAHGPAWDAARPLERQAAWQAHADFMNALEAEGFVLLGGTLDDPSGAAGALLVVRAKSAEDVRWRLAADPWATSGLLRVASVSGWTLRLGEDFLTRWAPARARAKAKESQGRERRKPRKAKVARAGKPRKAKVPAAQKPRKAKESQ
jgi:uncharacterized protein YciI